MKSPFPGMDPYLEWHWGDVHTSLVTYARDQLRPQLPGDLRVRVEEYVAVHAENGGGGGYYPDVRVVEHSTGSGTAGAAVAENVAVAEPLLVPMHTEAETQRTLHIVDTRSGNRIVTAIEVLSLSNKTSEEGRSAYRKKQQDPIKGGVNLVEIDLLRAGQYVLVVPQQNVPLPYQAPYRVCVHRADRPDHAEVYRVPLRDPLPTVRIPLREADNDVHLDLQRLIDQSYENGGYDDINYKSAPVPPLEAEDVDWADELLRKSGLR